MTLLQQFEELERLRSDLMARLDGLESATLNRAPARGGWSAAQVAAHLIQAERLSLEYLRKKTREPEAIADSGAYEALKSRLLALAMRLPFKITAPARSGDVPDRAELEELAADWESVRSGWREFIEQFPAELAGKAVYRHPVAGPLSLAQALKFLADHFKRHLIQIERTLGEAARAASAASAA